MDIRTCPKCLAKWMNGQHYWHTGAVGSDEDLAGLVCDQLGDDTCINPCRNTEHNGDTWEKRLNTIDSLTEKDS